MEHFERAAGAGAQLLRAGRLAPLGGDDPTRAVAFLLTFDVGRVLVTADPAAGRLVTQEIPDPDATPTGLLDAGEEEPWWRILGTPLSAARADPDGRRVALVFGAGGDAPRTLSLALDGGQIHATLASHG